ncbi:nitrate/nitrite transporter NrtS [Pseudohaliea rubra]|uniref:Uncharacterized protein n=1 Tax=Pseudohaliea rubra DSM 19751 TaxID=1265313 RepID=A0A095VU35_9GAMM|nr:nitrate/nitrite transporter NrtS [Pseudohaliea rubra]KGE04563.1 hypothetical protein HRUBRA_00902 [Pseudohaliea rubra DSM 19751]
MRHSRTSKAGTQTGGWRSAANPRIVKRSLKVSLVVGSVLTLINQSDTLFPGAPGLGEGARVFLTYLVPFSVSTWASVQASSGESR